MRSKQRPDCRDHFFAIWRDRAGKILDQLPFAVQEIFVEIPTRIMSRGLTEGAIEGIGFGPCCVGFSEHRKLHAIGQAAKF